jgi:hypothetical protein
VLASAISSFTDFTGTVGCTISPVGIVTSMVIGVKLESGSYPILGWIAGSIVMMLLLSAVSV